MSKLFLILILSSLGYVAQAQVFPVDTLLKNGRIQDRINLVFMGDGYQSSEMDLFGTDVDKFIKGIFTQSPFKEYKNYFNVFSIKVPSIQSGANHPQTSVDGDCKPVPVLTANNYFGSTFDYAGIHRLLVATNYSAIGSVLSANFPQYDQAFITVNTPYYGGSGGNISASSTNTNSKEVAIHEIGHSFASLADEYWAGEGYAIEKPNLTKESVKGNVKWKSWFGINGIDVYPHDENPAWKRPHQNCKMRFLNVPFCSVCQETFIERIHDLVNPVQSYLPSATEIAVSNDVQFSVKLIKPIPNTLKTSWFRNNVPAANNIDELTVALASLPLLQNKIRVEVIDTTSLSKSATHATKHIHVVEWKVTNSNVVTGVEIVPEVSEYVISVYPNPVADLLNFSYTISRITTVKIVLTDMSGKRLKNILNERQSPGQYDFAVSAADMNMERSGIYLLQLDIGGTLVTEKIIKL